MNPATRQKQDRIMQIVMLVGCISSPFEIWGLLYYGKLLPTTHLAKIGEPEWHGVSTITRYFMYQPLLVEFLSQQGVGLPVLLTLTVFGGIVGRKKLSSTLWMVPACGLIFVFYAQHDWMPLYRFFVPVLPFISLLVGFGFYEILCFFSKYRVWATIWCIIFVLAGADYIRYQAFGGEDKPRLSNFGLVKKNRGFWFLNVPSRIAKKIYPQEEFAFLLLRSVPPGEYISLRDIGFVGYLTMNPVWDTAGLVNDTVARARHDKSRETQQAMYDEMLSVQPGCFLLRLNKDIHAINYRTHSFLQNDPVAMKTYHLDHMTGKNPKVAFYLRSDLPEVNLAERLEQAALHYPEYRERLYQLSGK